MNYKLNDMINYNYWCLNTKCFLTSKIQRAKEEKDKDKEELCKECKEPLKLIGIATNIAHQGTRESNLKR